MLLFLLSMKFLSLKSLLKQTNQLQFKGNGIKTIADHNREVLVKQGREQFKQLLEKGLNVPIALL